MGLNELNKMDLPLILKSVSLYSVILLQGIAICLINLIKTRVKTLAIDGFSWTLQTKK